MSNYKIAETKTFEKLKKKLDKKLYAKYNVLLCQDHLTKYSYFTHYATNRNS